MTIFDLAVPDLQDELSLHRVGSWDEGRGSAPAGKIPPIESSSDSFCSHAIAFGSLVFGIQQGEGKGESWLTWKTSFAPDIVCRVASNVDGSIIVCATDTGTVALIRGTDGSVLATRKVTFEENCILGSPKISFIARHSAHQPTDAVAIGFPGSDSHSGLLLVSNIDAISLNHKNSLKVSDAARKITINSALKLQIHSQNDIIDFCGCFLDDFKLRFLALDTKGNISIQDYDGPGSPVETIEAVLSWRDEIDKASSIDTGVGLNCHGLTINTVLVSFTSFDTKRCAIHFYDPKRDLTVGSYNICSQNQKQRHRSKVLTIEPLRSAIPEKSASFAVAFKNDPDEARTMIHVIQACIEDQNRLGFFHKIYAIPINEPFLSLSLTAMDNSESFYSFRFKICLGNGGYVCKAFKAGGNSYDSSTIGRIRCLIRSERFDEAEQLVNVTGERLLVEDNYAGFHPSEIALARLQSILKVGPMCTKTTMAQSKQCFHKLASGCISGDERAGINLIEAAESIAQWVSPNHSRTPPTLSEATAALSTVVKVLAEVLNTLPPERHEAFREKKTQLEDQLATMKYLSTLLHDDEPNECTRLSSLLQGSRNPGQLFANLISNNCFFEAQVMWNSYLKTKIESYAAIESVVQIGPDVDPHCYLVLLEECIMPSLSISHELLPSVRKWACALADKLDENDNLDDAIRILASMERATNNLQLHVHGSFSSFNPFRDGSITRKRKAALVNHMSSFSSHASLPSSPQVMSSDVVLRNGFRSTLAYPTIFGMGQLKGGAKKKARNDREGFGDINDEAMECCVREKLLHAECLKAARSLGLGRGIARLGSFAEFGGLQQFSWELVHSISTSSSTHEKRQELFTDNLKPFCDRFEIDFDGVLLRYLESLCGSKQASSASIEEAASVARCCRNVSKKCQGILLVLKAALLCKISTNWLTELSRCSIEWSAHDLGLRSELVEASRLLLVDSIVRKYCGDAGCDLFRVDNPRHVVFLLEYVTQHFRSSSVLDDILDLSDAFNHLSRTDACAALCCQAINRGDIGMCFNFVESLYRKDPLLADDTSACLVSYCTELVDECSKQVSCGFKIPTKRLEELKKRAMNGSAAVCAIIPLVASRSQIAETAMVNDHSERNDLDLELAKQDFLSINELQRIHSIFLSRSDLRCTEKVVEVAVKILQPVADAFVLGDYKVWNVKLSRTKRACSMLAAACECSDSEFWCAVVSNICSPLKWEWDDSRCIGFLGDTGVLSGHSSPHSLSSRLILSVAFGLCLKASNQARTDQNGCNENFGRALSLLNDYCLVSCPSQHLNETQNLSTLVGSVWQVLLRGDGSVGEKLETLRDELLMKSWSLRDTNPLCQTVLHWSTPLCRAPVLYDSWYIGDGLLLPPAESISRSVNFCRELMIALGSWADRSFSLSNGGIHEMTTFLFHRGALSAALRILSCSSVILLCSGVSDATIIKLAQTIEEIFNAAIERSLGGVENGITGKIVDSQQAVSLLLCLPKKSAFKVYKSAIPTARSTKDFSRVLALANIALVAGSGRHGVSGWKTQAKLLAQCKSLSNQAVWWNFLKKNNISFDQKLFDSDKKSQSSGRAYAKTLIVPILIKLYTILKKGHSCPVEAVLRVLLRYAEIFDLKERNVVEAYIEYLMSPPGEDISNDDIRANLPAVEQSSRILLLRLEPHAHKQVMVLRGCVLLMENDQYACKDYDRHALLLSFYLEALQKYREQYGDKDSEDQQEILRLEIEMIEKRCDALAILSSVFNGEKHNERPSFPSFFSPLPSDISKYKTEVYPGKICGILGSHSSSSNFDPLDALRDVWLRSCDMATCTALAPLCLPLGLPSGYIHARFLMERFRWSSENGTALPAFDHDVLPVFGRVQSLRDKTELAQWCADHYRSDDNERLKCLEVALTWAEMYSNEMEHQRIRLSRSKADADSLKQLGNEENEARATFERLKNMKSALADKIGITIALERGNHLVTSIVTCLLTRLKQTIWKAMVENPPPPDTVIKVLLAEASLLAAIQSNSSSTPLTMEQFRQFSSAVRDACNLISEQHSHIHLEFIVRNMIRSWLFQGDKSNGDVEMDPQQLRPGSLLCAKPSKIQETDMQEEDTINFVMDLSTVQDEDNFWEEASSGFAPERANMTSDEEPSTLKKSEREISEEMTVRVALRVAFVLACDDKGNQDFTSSLADEENNSAIANSRVSTRQNMKGKPGGLLARIDKGGSKQYIYMMDCAKDLLQVVFAKPERQCESRLINENDIDRTLGKIVTFSMRHRALRCAAVLIPQEALEQVVDEQGYLRLEGEKPTCYLKNCAFGAFVANECEQIGMPLSHSDLAQISSMHFSSYARTLWRYHRDGSLKGSHGRLLLLLLEMSLKDEKDIDAAFVDLILKEMARLNLTRSLLLACEHVVSMTDRMLCEKYATLIDACSDRIKESVEFIATAMLGELKDWALAEFKYCDEACLKEAANTIRRVERLIHRFAATEVGQKQLCDFIEALIDAAAISTRKRILLNGFEEAFKSALRHVKDKAVEVKLTTKIQHLPGIAL